MKTTCAYCGVGCGIRLSREGDNWQLQGDEQHPANGGALCVKGASLLESLSFPDRLLYPRWLGQRAHGAAFSAADSALAALPTLVAPNDR